jgi:oligosaccharyltransferase complex subunit delta (ribophorin II)
MRFLHTFAAPLLLLAAGAAEAASSWTFDDATVQVGAKKGTATKEKYALENWEIEKSVPQQLTNGNITHRFSESTPLSQPVTISNADSIKVLLVAKDGGKAKRPHQAFVVLHDDVSGLEAPFLMTVKENGKAVVEIVSYLFSLSLSSLFVPYVHLSRDVDHETTKPRNHLANRVPAFFAEIH